MSETPNMETAMSTNPNRRVFLSRCLGVAASGTLANAVGPMLAGVGPIAVADVAAIVSPPAPKWVCVQHNLGDWVKTYWFPFVDGATLNMDNSDEKWETLPLPELKPGETIAEIEWVDNEGVTLNVSVGRKPPRWHGHQMKFTRPPRERRPGEFRA